MYLTHDLPSEGVQVLAIWLEQEGASSPGGGIDAQVMSVPVESGAMPVGAQVQSARTDASGRFSHPRSIEGGVTLRLGALPSNCRRPADRVVAVVAGAVQRVQLDVLCYGPKTPAAPIE
ncbi:MAG TPA: hypothetical protein VFV36_04815 [Candidatus Methylomirabilis sp.]|nr:hypothetical protein [Candidatus Methylomirabilis sp.]